MKPVFFPYTYLTEPAVNACSCFFSGISVLQSSRKHVPEQMKQWSDQGFLDIVLPEPKVSGVFDKILAETENWVRSHGGGVSSFLKGYQEDVPFFEPSSVWRIRQDIRAAGRSVSFEARQEALFRARIFLQIAQEFDAHNHWLSHQLQQQESMERNLYRELRGDEDPTEKATVYSRPPESEDPFQYMILDRLKAWSRVMLSHGNVQGPWVTTCDAVLALIQEHAADSGKLILAATVPPIRKEAATAKKEIKNLMDYCEKLANTSLPVLDDSGLLDTYPAETGDTPFMKLYLLPGIAPGSLCQMFSEKKRPGVEDAARETNTLIGYIRMATA